MSDYTTADVPFLTERRQEEVTFLDRALRRNGWNADHPAVRNANLRIVTLDGILASIRSTSA